MSPPVWSYSAMRDSAMWMCLAAGAAGAVPATLLWPVSGRAAVAGNNVSGPVIASLIVLPAALLSLWAIAWWAVALRRVVRLRRLVRTGIPVQARVQQQRLLRGKYRVFAGVALWLEYEVDGRTYRIRMRTTRSGIAAQARDLERVDLAVDPQAPRIAALIADGRLG